MLPPQCLRMPSGGHVAYRQCRRSRLHLDVSGSERPRRAVAAGGLDRERVRALARVGVVDGVDHVGGGGAVVGGVAVDRGLLAAQDECGHVQALDHSAAVLDDVAAALKATGILAEEAEGDLVARGVLDLTAAACLAGGRGRERPGLGRRRPWLVDAAERDEALVPDAVPVGIGEGADQIRARELRALVARAGLAVPR